MDYIPTLFSRRGSSIRPFRSIEDVMNSFLSGSYPAASCSGIESFPLDVVEQDKKYLVKANMPGVDRKGIELSFENGILTIQTNQAQEREESEGSYLLKERCSTSAARSVNLALADPAGKIDAVLKDGILTITIPKAQEKQAKRIEIA